MMGKLFWWVAGQGAGAIGAVREVVSMRVGKSRERQRGVIRTLVVLLVVLGIINVALAFLMARFPILVDISGYVQAGIELASIVFAVMMLRRELAENQRLEEAEFIVSLNEKFSESEACLSVFSYAIWEAHAKLLQLHESGKAPLEPEELKRVRDVARRVPETPSQVDLSGYLTFFESIFLLVDREVVSWDVLNELFKYRFFVGIHSEFVQRERLVRLPGNFKNIYYLEALWMAYNGDDPEQIAGYENRLEESCCRADKEADYQRIIDDMEERHHLLEDMWGDFSERTRS